MRRHLAAAGLALAVAASSLFAIVPTGSTQAASSGATFTVSANDGYGIGDCVASGSACARVVADAWCEAQGFARSASYGMVETVGSTGSGADRPISITCAP